MSHRLARRLLLLAALFAALPVMACPGGSSTDEGSSTAELRAR